jgi:hypothetical protein
MLLRLLRRHVPAVYCRSLPAGCTSTTACPARSIDRNAAADLDRTRAGATVRPALPLLSPPVPAASRAGHSTLQARWTSWLYQGCSDSSGWQPADAALWLPLGRHAAAL